MKEVTTMARQGDVLVMACSNVPKGLVPAPKDARGVVLAEGEATGHCHKFTDPNVCMLVREGAAFDVDKLLQIAPTAERAELVHDEHSTIAFAPGNYTVRRQREYAWAQEASRAVAD